ncbi:hypothetical protein Pmani_001561 [Petrolisthes manimaculis]|uniref:Uncharacterized protein n=1 Tax=Petrolisthes manimaculis TaxID=1843537 RepID=A0AAE1QKD5_9EUCA|nr:hypothetical protein Pmani_001561 [Petrolisthes manimaculis]
MSSTGRLSAKLKKSASATPTSLETRVPLERIKTTGPSSNKPINRSPLTTPPPPLCVIEADNYKGFKLEMEGAVTPTRPLYNTLMVPPASLTKKGINHTFDLQYKERKGSQEDQMEKEV